MEYLVSYISVIRLLSYEYDEEAFLGFNSAAVQTINVANLFKNLFGILFCYKFIILRYIIKPFFFRRLYSDNDKRLVYVNRQCEYHVD